MFALGESQRGLARHGQVLIEQCLAGFIRVESRERNGLWLIWRRAKEVDGPGVSARLDRVVDER